MSSSEGSDDEFQLNNDECIYEKSDITTKDFISSFLWVCNDFRLPKNKREILIKSIRSLFPMDNKIPPSYRKLKKFLHLSKSKVKVICRECADISLDGQECTKQSCQRKKKLDNLNVQVIEYNLNEQLQMIISRQKNVMHDYKSKINFI